VICFTVDAVFFFHDGNVLHSARRISDFKAIIIVTASEYIAIFSSSVSEVKL